MIIDNILIAADTALRTLFATPYATRPLPKAAESTVYMDKRDCDQSRALMRVNHVGEVCAQALYAGQVLTARDPAVRALLTQSGREEQDHLAWCKTRLDQLEGRPSLLNPVWYLGAFVMGVAAGLAGDKYSLGFVAETELQVEQHLADHLNKLPKTDHASRAILTQMQQDEVRHGAAAEAAGSKELPDGVKTLMRAVSKIMTTTAYRI